MNTKQRPGTPTVSRGFVMDICCGMEIKARWGVNENFCNHICTSLFQTQSVKDVSGGCKFPLHMMSTVECIRRLFAPQLLTGPEFKFPTSQTRAV